MKYRGVEGGTHIGLRLCTTCRSAIIIKGKSEMDELTFCHTVSDLIGPLKFSVYECSRYDDKRLTSKWDMEDIAWVLLTNKVGKQIGFVSAKEFKKIEGEE